MALSKAERVARAKLAAHESWANTTDRAQRTAAARKASPGSVEYWLDRVDPNHEMDAETRWAAASNKRQAHMSRLAYNRERARRAKKEAGT